MTDIKKFETTICGKWILAGEHTVIRGGPAILFPLPSFKLLLTYYHASTPWQLQLRGNLSDAHIDTVQAVINQGLQLLKKEISHGTLVIENQIPISAGLGASAALCTAISEWFIHLGWLHRKEFIEFARQLENFFHGESSGADIAVTAMNQAIYFARNQNPQPFTPNWKPNWYLSYSNEQSATSDCLKKVSQLWKIDPIAAKNIDELMKNSVLLAKHALSLNEKNGLALLKEAIEQAANAFLRWNLISDKLKNKMDALIKAGALAVKPTGSGDGGYILSLWNNHIIPSQEHFITL